MYRGLLLSLLLFTLTSCASYGPAGMSTDMHQIVSGLTPNGRVDTSKLYHGQEDEFDFIKKQSRVEVYHIPLSQGIADVPQYTVYYFKSDKQYWVTCIGGVAGVSELYGPAQFPAD